MARVDPLPPPRRSLRLNPPPAQARIGVTGPTKPTLIVEMPLPSSKKRKLSAAILDDAPCRVGGPHQKAIDPAVWNEELSQREEELNRKSDELDRRIKRASEKDTIAGTLLEQCRIRSALDTLSQVEEHFTCSLCYEVMSCPYALTPSRCGHTFCAGCAMKWFFARLHRACGFWHERVVCPMCRAMLMVTPERTPRTDLTFPFTPNRTAELILGSLMDKLAHSDIDSSTRLICTDEENATEISDRISTLQDWKEGGRLREEWKNREAHWRAEINSFADQWTTLTTTDFTQLKTRLGV